MADQVRRIGEVRISYDDLLASLGLPEGHEVVAIVPQDADAIANGRLSVIVTGPAMPTHWTGAPATWVAP